MRRYWTDGGGCGDTGLEVEGVYIPGDIGLEVEDVDILDRRWSGVDIHKIWTGGEGCGGTGDIGQEVDGVVI